MPTTERDVDDTQALWLRFIAGREVEVREQLIDNYRSLARRIAATLYSRRLSDAIEFDDYLQHAQVGLIEAVDRFDPTRDIAFATYATYRIRGAVLTALEQSTEIAAQRSIAHAPQGERLESLSSSADDGFAGVVDVAVCLALGYMLEDGESAAAPESRTGVDPYKNCELQSLQRRVLRLIEVLPERERRIIEQHYLEGREFNAIGTDLGLTKGRVSQLHARALRLLREAHATLRGFDVNC